jgi:hypothetical protein
MKSIIILMLLVATAMCEVQMTADAATLWKLTWESPESGFVYKFKLTYSIGGASDAVTTVSPSGTEIGFVCLVTDANFTLTAASSYAGWSMGSINAGLVDTTISSTTGWNTIFVYSMSAMTYASETSIVNGATGNLCPSVDSTAVTSVSAVITFNINVLATCANLPANGAATWYGRCFHKAPSSALFSGASSSLVVSSGQNVTIGASTFTAGATILAAIAYLQF